MFNLNSQNALISWALIYGVANALDQLLAGNGVAAFVTFFMGSAIIGNGIVWGLVWVVLALIKKRHLQNRVVCWILIAGTVLSLLVTFMLFGETLAV